MNIVFIVFTHREKHDKRQLLVVYLLGYYPQFELVESYRQNKTVN